MSVASTEPLVGLDLKSNDFPPLIDKEYVFGVTEVSTTLKKMVENTFSGIRVKGEISSYKLHSSGHHYFCLKDQDSVLDGVIWRGTVLRIRPEDGLEVIASGRLTTFAGRSKYQMVITGIEPSGEGALLKLFLERKQRLQAEGLFDHKKPLPTYPNCIGVITSQTGAVIRDILHRISDRYPCHVVVWPVLVQGPDASAQITDAIIGFNALDVALRPDVLIVARGGGSLEDLFAFNEENVVRATASSRIPIISAIGHETDTTLIDFASDRRAPTPTAAAELATPDRIVLSNTVLGYHNRLYTTLTRILDSQKMLFAYLDKRFPDLKRWILEKEQTLDEHDIRLKNGINRVLEGLHKSVQAFKLPSIMRHIQITQERFIRLSVHDARNRYLEKQAQKIGLLSVHLEGSSYKKILDKGFFIIKHNNAIFDLNSAKIGDTMRLTVQGASKTTYMDSIIQDIT